MEKSILLVLLGNRVGTAVKVQEVLTTMGCFIKTRLGIHDGTPDTCTNTGLLILEIIGTEEEKKKLVGDLKKIKDVKVKLVELAL